MRKAKPISLEEQTEAQVRAIDQADILVGIPSFNNTATIGHVIKATITGLAKHFPDRRAVLINSDGGSTDGTPDVAVKAGIDLGARLISDRQPLLHRFITPYRGTPGKSHAVRTIFEIARRLNARAGAVVDADLRSMTPEWIELLIRPILDEGFDYVAPYYLRHKYEGMLTTSLAYPLTRALYGVQVRQPIGSDFGFSGALSRHDGEKSAWESDITRFEIDLWMTTAAVASGMRICQSFLGPKLQELKDQAADLPTLLTEVVGTVFTCMEAHQHVWFSIQGSQPTSLFGFQYEGSAEPAYVNVDRMMASFRRGLADLRPILEVMLAPETLRALVAAQSPTASRFHIPNEVWAQTVYDCAAAFHRRRLNRTHVLKAMTPLYLGQTASFVVETQGLTTREAEEHTQRLGQVFEQYKPYLLDRWGPIVED